MMQLCTRPSSGMALLRFFTSTSPYISLFQYVNNQQPLPLLLLSAPPTSLFGLDQKVSRTLLLQRFAFSFSPSSFHPSLILSLCLSRSTFFFVFLFSPAVLHSCFPGRKRGGGKEREIERGIWGNWAPNFIRNAYYTGSCVKRGYKERGTRK